VKLPGFFRNSPHDSADFWGWFAANEAKIRTVSTGKEPIMGELAKQLGRVDKALRFEMSVGDEGVREFIVSAGGVRDVIPAVEALVATAPSISGWKMISFRQRKPGTSIGMGDRTLTENDIWFDATPHSEHVDLNLYVTGFDGKSEWPYQIAFLFLDTTLGEYDVMTKVGKIDFYALPPDPAAQGLKPINELPPIVDAL
jgi:hypothetical protein